MFNFIKPVKNEKGYFLIMSTILLLALLTIISIAATNTANTEVQTASNDMVYQRNLYLAEGAALEAVDRLENDPDPRGLPFVVTGLKAIDDDTYIDHWDTAPGGANGIATHDSSGDTRFVAGYEGTPSGYSLGMGKSRIHEFAVYGRVQKQGATTIKLGYLKAF